MNGLNAILIVLVLSNFYVLGASRMNAVIGTVGIQGILLGMLPSILAHQPSLEVITLSSLAILIKGVAFPYLLFRAMREAQIRREVEPLAGYVATLLLGALGTGVAIGLGRSLPLIR